MILFDSLLCHSVDLYMCRDIRHSWTRCTRENDFEHHVHTLPNTCCKRSIQTMLLKKKFDFQKSLCTVSDTWWSLIYLDSTQCCRFDLLLNLPSTSHSRPRQSHTLAIACGSLHHTFDCTRKIRTIPSRWVDRTAQEWWRLNRHHQDSVQVQAVVGKKL